MDKKHPFACVAVFVRNWKNEYLIGERRANTATAGKNEFCIPGGKIDWREDPEEAAIRETKEEAGIEIRIDELLGVGSDKWSTSDKHFITIYYLATITKGTPSEKEPEKLGNWKFLPKHEIPQLFATAGTMLCKLP